MKKNSFRVAIGVFFLAIALTITLLSSCVKNDNTPRLKVGLVCGVGTFNDRGFNQQALIGLNAASSIVPIDWEARESGSAALIDSNIRYFVKNNFDLVITLGYDAAQATMNAVTLHTSVKFLLLDYTFTVLPKNLECVNFQVDQASFPCGFLAAWWATQKNPVNPIIAYVAGPNIPEIQQFTVSYSKGVDYFNTQYSKSVLVSGANATDFNDTLQGARLADSLINQGADVVFACAGKTGNGALYKAKEASKYGIGVDVDQYISIPEVGPVLLTSCMKRLDRVIKSEVINTFYDQFRGGQIIHCTLANQGVEMAPYHNFDSLIPSEIKSAVNAVKTGIMNGTISTGWPQ
ncbi:MAG: BMP family ABC transporter substrate-binding protein [Bacteroidales bacterium]|jgi:basic membrane protein A|nr:BMP family ABC transporter substrate-binding protein [Bacteroidales bacterium]